MKVNITARKFKARDVLKEYIQGQLEELSIFSDDILDIEVILSFQNTKDSIKTAEILIKVPGQVFTAKEDSDEFEKSVKIAVGKLMRQMQKYKEKKAQH